MTQTKYDKAVSVCFSGHRIIPSIRQKELSQRLLAVIARAYAEGYRCFYCGMAMGFDLLAAKAALSLQLELPELQVFAVVPYRNQTDRWNERLKSEYGTILRMVNEVIVLSEHYYHGCLLRRNDYMVNHSSRLIAWYDGQPKGGTFYTCRKAREKDIPIINLY